MAMSLALGMGMTAPVAFDSDLNPFFTEESSAHTRQIDYTERDVNCLARNIYFEARGESEEGQQAVALVTVNRVLDENYPDTVCEVVYQSQRTRHGTPIRNRCQFSWFCDGMVDRIRDDESYQNSLRIARDVLENRIDDFTHGAVNYHANYVQPSWSSGGGVYETAEIGQHIFYARIVN